MDVVHIANYLGYSIPHPQSLVTIYKEILIIHVILHLNDKFMNVDLRLCHKNYNLIMPWKIKFSMSTCHLSGF
jgi:hypothetical protein